MLERKGAGRPKLASDCEPSPRGAAGAHAQELTDEPVMPMASVMPGFCFGAGNEDCLKSYGWRPAKKHTQCPSIIDEPSRLFEWRRPQRMPPVTKSAFVIFVFDSSTGEKFPYNTTLSQTILGAKEELAEFVTVPAAYMRLSCRGKILADQHTLLNYEIKAGEILHLTRTRKVGDISAAVQLVVGFHDPTPRPTLAKFRLGARVTDTVFHVKQQLEKLSGVAVNSQRLTMGGKTLSNERKLCDYGVQHGSTELQLVCPSSMTNSPLAATLTPSSSCLNRSEFPVNVKEVWPHGQVYRIGLRIDRPIYHFKEQVAMLTGISTKEQLLMHRGRLLQDGLTPNYYNLEGGDTVDLAVVGGARLGRQWDSESASQNSWIEDGQPRQLSPISPRVATPEMPVQAPVHSTPRGRRRIILAPLDLFAERPHDIFPHQPQMPQLAPSVPTSPKTPRVTFMK